MNESLQSVRYDDFTGGEFGSLGPAKAPRGTFTSRNLQLYTNGSLGVRAGTVALAYTGTANGKILGMGWRGTPGFDIFYIQGSSVRSAPSQDVGGAITAYTGGLAATPTEPVQFVEFGTMQTLITVYGDASYELDHVGLTVTALTGSPGGKALALYGERLMVAGTSTNPNRIHFSDPADFNTWPAANFYNVGNASGEVVAVWAQKNHLSIATGNNEWWVQTGVPAGILRRVTSPGVHPWVFSPDAGFLIGTDAVVFVGIGGDYPSIFNGTQATESRYVSINNGAFATGKEQVKVIRGTKPDEALILFPGTQRIGFLRNGAWTVMDMGVEFTTYATSDAQGQITLTTLGGVSTKPTFHTWRTILDRPGITSDGLSSPVDSGDPTSAPQVSGALEFPTEWAQDGKEVRVRSVAVDFEYWDTGATDDDILSCKISTHNTEGVVDTDSSTQSFSYSTVSPSATGIRKRYVFRFGPDVLYGNGFQVKLPVIKGIAIHSVTAWFDERNIPGL